MMVPRDGIEPCTPLDTGPAIEGVLRRTNPAEGPYPVSMSGPRGRSFGRIEKRLPSTEPNLTTAKRKKTFNLDRVLESDSSIRNSIRIRLNSYALCESAKSYSATMVPV